MITFGLHIDFLKKHVKMKDVKNALYLGVKCNYNQVKITSRLEVFFNLANHMILNYIYGHIKEKNNSHVVN